MEEREKTIDELIDKASTATDKGNYKSAIKDLEEALASTRGIFGDNAQLAEMEKEISEIRELLAE